MPSVASSSSPKGTTKAAQRQQNRLSQQHSKEFSSASGTDSLASSTMGLSSTSSPIVVATSSPLSTTSTQRRGNSLASRKSGAGSSAFDALPLSPLIAASSSSGAVAGLPPPLRKSTIASNPKVASSSSPTSTAAAASPPKPIEYITTLDGQRHPKPDPYDDVAILRIKALNKGKGHTYTFDDLPEHMQDNPFIRNHYRLYLSTEESIRSIFQIHSETGNIWTHLIGFVIFLCLGIWVLGFILPSSSSSFTGAANGGSFVHYILFGLLTLGSLMCMFFSAFFHTMSNHMSIKTFHRFHALDYLGISCIIIGSFIPACYYIYVCEPFLQWGYIMLIGSLGIAGVACPLMECFREPAFYWARLAIYASIGASPVIPCFHTFFVTPLNHTTLPMYAGVFLSLLLYAVGVTFYATKFPECLAPGRFDIMFQSHQLWHTCVLMGALSHYFTCIALYQNWSVMQGRC